MTQLENARKGTITAEMKAVAAGESLDSGELLAAIASGLVVIPANRNHKNLQPIGIGKGLRTKINANIGTSGDFSKLDDEVRKLKVVLSCGCDTVMDLSTGGDVTAIRRALLAQSSIPFGNVPVYEMMVEAPRQGKTFVSLEIPQMLEYIRRQAEDGVDFMTIHAGLTLKAIEKLKKKPRLAGIVSRGGSMLTGWMLHNKKENPFFEHFDQLLTIAREFDVTLSLGDGLRPGALADGSDWAQLEELLTLGELVQRSRRAGVQVMVEGPGHLPLQQVRMNIHLQKEVCAGAPFYVLGPVVTDVAPGYDHITAAIGSAVAGAAGADFLCYVTPAEHLGLPAEQDVREGIMASRIAAHVADIAKGLSGALDWDRRMADARRRLDWSEQEKLCIDPEKFKQVRERRGSRTDACSMCGEFCVYKVLENYQL
ncbi:MAG: phosphomethylpyrimidine synthase ThiC [Candidatus Aminicenantes bacterium]|nr:phosphomethylpyrimidine synthase ThiC [Acidobacteriota bacterium]MCG2812709.1 phosphomethylpyrimidine synthase ThiC [Candidatus Aminicenantes bacterium]